MPQNLFGRKVRPFRAAEFVLHTLRFDSTARLELAIRAAVIVAASEES
jgi:hypothetical protein